MRLQHGCVDNLWRTRFMCEVISSEKRGKGIFRHFFLNRNMRCYCCCFFFGERRMNGASSWTPPKKGRLIELRQDHYTVSIILPVFLQEPGLVPALSLGVLSGKSFSGRVQKWPSRKRLGTRLGYCFVLDLNWSSSSASLSPWTSQAVVTGMHINEMTFLVQNKR